MKMKFLILAAILLIGLSVAYFVRESQEAALHDKFFDEIQRHYAACKKAEKNRPKVPKKPVDTYYKSFDELTIEVDQLGSRSGDIFTRVTIKGDGTINADKYNGRLSEKSRAELLAAINENNFFEIPQVDPHVESTLDFSESSHHRYVVFTLTIGNKTYRNGRRWPSGCDLFPDEFINFDKAVRVILSDWYREISKP